VANIKEARSANSTARTGISVDKTAPIQVDKNAPFYMNFVNLMTISGWCITEFLVTYCSVLRKSVVLIFLIN
jgi:hypothetical protein